MTDLRELGIRPSFPVASNAFAQLTYDSGVSGAGLIETAELAGINGVIEQIEIEISAAGDGSLVAEINIASEQDAALFNEGSLADATTHLKQALSKGGTTDADFNPALVDGTLTLTGTIDKDPSTGGVTIDVTIFYR